MMRDLILSAAIVAAIASAIGAWQAEQRITLEEACAQDPVTCLILFDALEDEPVDEGQMV